MTTWVTFVPCFFWILLGSLHRTIARQQASQFRVSAITAAVVGVVLNLAVWFSLHTLFERVTTKTIYGLRLQLPDFATVNGRGS